MRNFSLIVLVVLLSSCGATMDLPTVDKVDLDAYTGRWYEIARLPNNFEKGLKCVTANYSLKDNGKIEVLNKGYSIKKEGKIDTAKGTAWVPDPNFPGRLKVSFFWPFAGDYYIIELDDDYKYVLVGAPSRKYLWVLSRTKVLDPEVYSELVQIAKMNNFETENLIKVNQECDQ